MLTHSLLRPYERALDLEDHFRSPFLEHEFYDVVKVFELLKDKEAQLRTLEVFKNLTKQALLKRVSRIVRLAQLQDKIHIGRYVIPRS